jgi:hypothetical protein
MLARAGGESQVFGGYVRGENLQERYRVLAFACEAQQDAATPSRGYLSRRGAPYAYSGG